MNLVSAVCRPVGHKNHNNLVGYMSESETQRSIYTGPMTPTTVLGLPTHFYLPPSGVRMWNLIFHCVDMVVYILCYYASTVHWVSYQSVGLLSGQILIEQNS
jgi:hypothetical protein